MAKQKKLVLEGPTPCHPNVQAQNEMSTRALRELTDELKAEMDGTALHRWLQSRLEDDLKPRMAYEVKRTHNTVEWSPGLLLTPGETQDLCERDELEVVIDQPKSDTEHHVDYITWMTIGA